MPKQKTETYIVTITVKSQSGKPDVRTVGGDTIFYRLAEGQSARWTIKKQKPKPRLPRGTELLLP